MSYESVILADSPRYFYRMTEPSSTTLTDSADSYNGTYNGSCTLAQTGLLAGSTDTSVLFNGTTSYAEAACAFTPGSISVECWFNLSSFSTTPFLVCQWSGAGANYQSYRIQISTDGKVGFFISGDWVQDNSIVSQSTVSTGTTYHVVCTWLAGSATMHMYINGSEVTCDHTGAFTWSTLWGTTVATIGGSSSDHEGTVGNFAAGKIQAVALYNAVLTSTQVTAHYEAGTTSSGLTAGTLSLSSVTTSTASLAIGTNVGTSPYSNQLQRTTHGGSSWSNIGTSVAGATASLPDATVTPGFLYDYRVGVTDAATGPVYSNTLSVYVPTATAATHYVSEAGSDTTGNGTIGNPYATFSTAYLYSIAGDTLSGNGGDSISDSLSMNATGGRRTINSYGTGKCTIAGGTSAAIQITNVDAITINNLILSGAALSGSGTSFLGVIDVIESNSARHTGGITITNNTITSGEVGISWHTTGDSNSYSSVTVSGNSIHDCVCIGMVITGGSNIQILNNDVYNIPGTTNTHRGTAFGIAMGGTDMSGTGAARSNVRGNHVYHIGYSAIDSGVGGPGGIMANSPGTYTISENVVHDVSANDQHVDGAGIDLDTGCDGYIVERNFTYHNAACGYMVYQTVGTNVFRFNLSYNDGWDTAVTTSKASFRYTPTSGVCYIYNNTLINMTKGQSCFADDTTTAGLKLYNNVLISYAPNSPTMLLSSIDDACDIQGNAYGALNAMECKLGTTTYSNLSAWRTATGMETSPNGLNFQTASDHGFVSAAPFGNVLPSNMTTTLKGFSLVPSNPSVAAGLDLNSLYGLNVGTVDILGNTLSVPYSVGAISPSWNGSRWDVEVNADAPRFRIRLGDASTLAYDTQVFTEPGEYVSCTQMQPSLLQSDTDYSTAFSSSGVNFTLGYTLNFSAMSIEAWIKPTSVTGSHTIVCDYYSPTGVDQNWQMTTEGTEVQAIFVNTAGFGTGALIAFTTDAGLEVGQTYHIVATSTGSAIAIYINGVSHTVTYHETYRPPLTVGTMKTNLISVGVEVPSETNHNYFAGVIDEVAIYPTALSSGRVLAHYEASLASTQVNSNSMLLACF